MKTIHTVGAALSVLLLSSAAHADYKYNLVSQQFYLSASIPQKPSASVPITLAQGNTLQGFSDLVYSTVTQGYISTLQNTLPNAPDYRGYTPYISGRIKLNFNPAANGYTAMTISGLTLGFSLYQKPHSGPIPANCTSNVTLNHATLQSSQTNLATGSIEGLTLASDTPVTSFSCSTSLSWIPGLGNILDSAATSIFASKAGAAINSQFSSNPGIQLRGASFAGLDTVLPNGALMIAGRDMGLWVRNNLDYLVRNGSEVTVNPVPDYPVGGGGGYVNDSWTAMSLKFADGTVVTVTGTRTFQGYWDSNCGGRDGSMTCAEP